jgi:probable F420-dependent oxidoreductase
MEFFFAYPEANGTRTDLLDAGDLADVARAVEGAGFDGLSLTEHPIPGARWLDAGGHQTLDPLVGLSFAAAVTSRLRLLTHVCVAPYRNPFLLAKAASSVDRLSKGRMIVGLGVGYHKAEYHALGVDFEERNVLFDEALDALPLHWRGEPFSYQGRQFDARDVIARPRPTQNPIPIWIGGNSRLSRRRAATRAQGWMPMSGGPTLSTAARTPAIADEDTLAKLIAEVQQQATDHGRGPIDINWNYFGIDTDRPDRDAERHRDAFGSLTAIGVTSLVVTAKSDDPARTLGFIAGVGETYLR